MAGVSPEIARLFERKPRAKASPAPVVLQDLGPLEDEAGELRRELEALSIAVARAQDERDTAQARVEELERAQIGGARHVERLEGERDEERRQRALVEEILGGLRGDLDEARGQLSAPKASLLAGTWKGCAKVLFQRCASLRAMNDRLRVPKGERPHHVGSVADMQVRTADLPRGDNPYVSLPRSS